VALRVLVFAALRVLAVYLVIDILVNLVPFLISITEVLKDGSTLAFSPLVSVAMMIIIAIFL
jgi:hypothetical protein